MKKTIRFLLLFFCLAVGSYAFAADEGVEQAVRGYLSQLTPEQLAQSDAYFEGGYWLQLWNLIYGLVIAAFLMRTGWSLALRDWAVRCTRFRFLHNWLYFIQYFTVVALLSFPLTIYQDYYREHKYGLSNLAIGPWFVEQLKGLLIGLMLGGFFTAVIYVLIAKLRRTWWVWGAGFSVLFLLFVQVIAPVYLAPVFNHYTPLPSGEVRENVLSLARSNGVPADEVYEFDASKQSKRISANVSGLFGTTRISLNDNLLKRATLPEIRAVMGHETGHYVLNHGFKFVTEFGLVLLFDFYLIYLGLNFIQETAGHDYGLNGVQDVAGAPLLFALLSIFMFFATPLTNSIVRTAEIEADVFGLNLAREPDGAARVAVQLSEYRKMSPGYWEEILFYDHPSGESRIRRAMIWKKENAK